MGTRINVGTGPHDHVWASHRRKKKCKTCGQFQEIVLKCIMIGCPAKKTEKYSCKC